MATGAAVDVESPPAAAGAERRAAAHALGAGFQLGYIVRFAAAIACGAFAAGLVVYLLLASELGSYAQNVTIIHGAKRWVLWAAVLSALVQVAFTGAVVTVMALLASHKVAGPSVRLVRLLRGVAAGVLPGPVRFRRGDQTGALETRFGELSRALAERHECVRRGLREVEQAERDLERALRGPASEEERLAAAKDFRERADALASLLARLGGGPAA